MHGKKQYKAAEAGWGTRWALMFFGILMASYGMAQNAAVAPPAKGKDVQLVQMADDVYRNSGAKRQALDQYKQALESNPANLRANYMAGICYLQTIQKERALAYFLKVNELKPDYESGLPIGKDLFPDLDFLIGQAYQYGENFDKAGYYYEQFANRLDEGKGTKIDRKSVV